MSNTHNRIEQVMRFAKKPLADFEFKYVSDPVIQENGLEFIGCSEATLGRRLREMREAGLVTAQKRADKNYLEYALAVKAPCPEPVCPI